MHNGFLISTRKTPNAANKHVDFDLADPPPVLDQMNAKVALLVSNGIMDDSAKSLNANKKT